MPFESKKQQRKCYAMKAKGENGSWDCGEWSAETAFDKLPETAKKAAFFGATLAAKHANSQAPATPQVSGQPAPTGPPSAAYGNSMTGAQLAETQKGYQQQAAAPPAQEQPAQGWVPPEGPGMQALKQYQAKGTGQKPSEKAGKKIASVTTSSGVRGLLTKAAAKYAPLAKQPSDANSAASKNAADSRVDLTIVKRPLIDLNAEEYGPYVKFAQGVVDKMLAAGGEKSSGIPSPQAFGGPNPATPANPNDLAAAEQDMSQFTMPGIHSVISPQQQPAEKKPGMPGSAMPNPIGQHGMGGLVGTPADTAISTTAATQ